MDNSLERAGILAERIVSLSQILGERMNGVEQSQELALAFAIQDAASEIERIMAAVK